MSVSDILLAIPIVWGSLNDDRISCTDKRKQPGFGFEIENGRLYGGRGEDRYRVRKTCRRRKRDFRRIANSNTITKRIVENKNPVWITNKRVTNEWRYSVLKHTRFIDGETKRSGTTPSIGFRCNRERKTECYKRSNGATTGRLPL